MMFGAQQSVSYLGNPHWVSLTQWVGQNDQFGSDPMEQSLLEDCAEICHLHIVSFYVICTSIVTFAFDMQSTRMLLSLLTMAQNAAMGGMMLVSML